jgi:transcriptional regulator with XRE-family HTH domain
MVETEAPDVGKRIRALRDKKGYSLRALADRSGLSINAISLIERGENSPTVSSLHLLASALDVSITDFFMADQERSVVFVAPEGRLRSEGEGIAMESLGIGLPDQRLEPFLLHVAPEAGNMEQPVTHPGEELVFCLEGEIDYCVGNRVYTLATGYSLLFEATIPHCFYNRTKRPAVLMMVFYAGEGRHLARRLHLEFSEKGAINANPGEFSS